MDGTDKRERQTLFGRRNVTDRTMTRTISSCAKPNNRTGHRVRGGRQTDSNNIINSLFDKDIHKWTQFQSYQRQPTFSAPPSLTQLLAGCGFCLRDQPQPHISADLYNYYHFACSIEPLTLTNPFALQFHRILARAKQQGWGWRLPLTVGEYFCKCYDTNEVQAAGGGGGSRGTRWHIIIISRNMDMLV